MDCSFLVTRLSLSCSHGICAAQQRPEGRAAHAAQRSAGLGLFRLMANWLCLMYCDFLLRINAAPELVWLLESVSMESLVGVEHWDPASSLFPSQTEHYRLDWHRFNLKQRLQGRRALTVEEFEEKSRAGEEWGCLSRTQRLLVTLLFCLGVKPPGACRCSQSFSSVRYVRAVG